MERVYGASFKSMKGAMHAKIMMMGLHTGWAGSFNLSASSRTNADFMFEVAGSEPLKEVLAFFQETWETSEELVVASERPEVRIRRRVKGPPV